jgi:hypothetical protein
VAAESVFPKLTHCPDCGLPVKDMIYGMLAGPPGPNEIAAGCEMDPNSPAKGCDECGWRGAPGGRTWETSFTQTVIDSDPVNPEIDREQTFEFDLLTMNNEELLEFGKFNLEARFELVHQGLDPRWVERYYDQFDIIEAGSFPLFDTEITLAYYNELTNMVEQVCYFFARNMNHQFEYLRPGMRNWDATPSSVKSFHEVVFSMKKPDVTGWIINMPSEVSEEDNLSSPDNYGSPVIKAMILNKEISLDEMSKLATKLDRTVYWPYWFDPATYVTFWSRLR